MAIYNLAQIKQWNREVKGEILSFGLLRYARNDEVESVFYMRLWITLASLRKDAEACA